MDVTPLVKEGAKIIQAYADGNFRVSGEVYNSAIIVFESRVVLWDVNKSIDELELSDFDILLSMKDDADVFLLGTGKTMTFLSPELRQGLKSKGLHVEMMDTGAACRTYNVLMAEGRRVAAAMLLHK